ncbi:MAG: hypothetical protein J6Y80_03835, partial [Victivallales bacterium]|nr:hypothetical protein [Victivallales bacterium]
MVTFCTLILIALAGFVQAAPKSPFGAAASFAPTEGALVLRVELTGPAKGHFNAGFLKLALPEGYAAEAIEPPPPVPDELFEDGVYPAGTILYYRVSPAEPIPQMTLEIQGCVDDMCYMPQKIVLNETLVQETPPADAPASDNWYQGFAREEVTFGYSKAEEFASWLERAQAAGEESPQETNLLARVAGKYGLWLAALLVIPLGMLLNLTPCVLPMIPVTLAVLGASGAGDRRRGFLLGMAYGLAMAVAYGLAGAIFVKVGGRFGGINASPWFNWAAGIVMVCLGLSMFDLFCLDLSRFRKLPGGS